MRDAPHDELPFVRRLAEGVVAGAFSYGSYFWAGRSMAPDAAPFLPDLDARIPFVPETVWIYLFGYLACFLIAIATVRDARSYRATLVGFATLPVLALPFFLYVPIPGPRVVLPADDVSFSLYAMRQLYAADPPGNTFPSLHVACATYAAYATAQADRRWGRVAWALALGVAISVLTTKQHWVVDVPAGWALAAVGIAARGAYVNGGLGFGRNAPPREGASER